MILVLLFYLVFSTSFVLGGYVHECTQWGNWPEFKETFLILVLGWFFFPVIIFYILRDL